MKKFNTRLVPTLNGQAHVGHLFCALINQAEAHRSGGKFIVRFDDSQRAWDWICGEENIDKYRSEWREDLKWLGIKPDVWSSQKELMPKVERLCKTCNYTLPPDTFCDYDPPTVHCEGFHHTYPPNKRLSIEHVAMDFIEEVNFVIRGLDLLDEDCLYWVIADEMGLPRVRRDYIPRLDFSGDEISKTLGKFKLQDFRKAGIDPDDLIDNLSEDCLHDSDLGWTIDNLKLAPTLGTWVRKYGFSI